jgi:hypothetical protein
MATEAQIQANRSNAEKSTGPRTPEGKEKASQNSLKHGLFAREGVIRGEDPEEYEIHREMLLDQLDPVGPLEAILAARIVDLSWRLGRAAQNQNEAFGALYDRYVARQAAGPEADPRGDTGPGDAGGGAGLRVAGVAPARVEGVPPSHRESEALKTRGQDARDTNATHGREGRDAEPPEQRGAVLGRMILEDFEQEAVLERLLRYERRIESSFYRTLKELRHVRDQGRKADQEVAATLERWRQEGAEARKARAFACDPPPDGWPGPAGGTTNRPAGGDCGLGIADCGFKDAGLEQPTWALAPHDTTIPSFQHFGGAPTPPEETCKTNPIGGPGAHDCGLRIVDCGFKDAGLGQPTGALVPEEAGLTVESCKTNPISQCEVSSLKFQVSDQKEHVPGVLTSNFTLDTSNSPPAAPVGGVACKTNPISPGAAPRGLVGSVRVTAITDSQVADPASRSSHRT